MGFEVLVFASKSKLPTRHRSGIFPNGKPSPSAFLFFVSIFFFRLPLLLHSIFRRPVSHFNLLFGSDIISSDIFPCLLPSSLLVKAPVSYITIPFNPLTNSFIYRSHPSQHLPTMLTPLLLLSSPLFFFPTPAFAQNSTISAMTHVIAVGDIQGGLKFYPEKLTAKKGDLVQFQFYPKAHSVAQSSFDSPCQPLSSSNSSAKGFWSGMMPVEAGGNQTVCTVHSLQPHEKGGEAMWDYN